MRWTIGVRCNKKNKFLGDKFFLKENFKIRKIPELRNIYTIMKFRNFFSYFFISCVWKRMVRFLRENEKVLDRKCFFEFYPHVFTTNKIIEFFIPVGGDLKQLDFCSLKKSEYKSDKKNK